MYATEIMKLYDIAVTVVHHNIINKLFALTITMACEYNSSLIRLWESTALSAQTDAVLFIIPPAPTPHNYFNLYLNTSSSPSTVPQHGAEKMLISGLEGHELCRPHRNTVQNTG